MAIGIGIGTPFKKGGGQTWEQYWTSQSDFWGVGRSGLTIPDVHGNDAKILPSVMSTAGPGYFYRTGITVGTGDEGGFIEAMVYVDQTNILTILSSTTTTTSTRYIIFEVAAAGHLVFKSREPTAAPAIYVSAFRSTDVLSVGWHKVKVTCTDVYQFTVDDVNIAGGFISGSAVAWFADVAVAFRNNIAIGGRIQSNTTTIDTASKIAWVNYNDENRWILHGQGLWAYDNIGAVRIPWVGTPAYVYDASGSTFLLDNGYSVFKKTGELDEYVPNTSLNVPQTDAAVADVLATYTRYVDRDGSATKHNLAPSVIDFDYTDATPVAVKYLDRSNATYYGDAARTGHDYDATNVYRWKSEDIADPTYYYNWLNADYKSKVISRITQEDLIILTLDEILALK